MIDIIFYYGTEIIFVRIDGTTINFSTSSNMTSSTIDGLRLNKEGVVKEFPDLKDNDNWKEEAVKRFKDKIKSLKNEDERCNYIIEDLKKHGYQAKIKQKAGFRKEIIK
jgi:N-acetyl-anhydromuramyl-L-alanine amidase AmpD